MMDYNKLMEQLDSCLGLETSAMESLDQKNVFTESKEVIDNDDLVEDFEEKGDLVFEDPEGEKTPVEFFKESLVSFIDSLSDEIEDKEEIRNTIINLVDETLNINQDGELEAEAEAEVEGESATEETLSDKLLSLGTQDTSNEEIVDNNKGKSVQQEVGDLDKDDETAFEEMSAKMLDRYSKLSNRGQIKSNSASAGLDGTKVEIDREALNRVSCEFAYSSHHLEKMVTEAIKKGVI